MKIKSFAILAGSGLLAGYIAYIAPAMADYNNTAAPQAQMPNAAANNNTAGEDMMDPNANVGGMSDATKSNNGAYPANSGQQTNNNDTSSDQQITPDTATGDDDY